MDANERKMKSSNNKILNKVKKDRLTVNRTFSN